MTLVCKGGRQRLAYVRRQRLALVRSRSMRLLVACLISTVKHAPQASVLEGDALPVPARHAAAWSDQALGAQVGAARSTVVPAALAEALLRRLLPELEPTRFQHLMRVARHELFCVL